MATRPPVHRMGEQYRHRSRAAAPRRGLAAARRRCDPDRRRIAGRLSCSPLGFARNRAASQTRPSRHCRHPPWPGQGQDREARRAAVSSANPDGERREACRSVRSRRCERNLVHQQSTAFVGNLDRFGTGGGSPYSLWTAQCSGSRARALRGPHHRRGRQWIFRDQCDSRSRRASGRAAKDRDQMDRAA